MTSIIPLVIGALVAIIGAFVCYLIAERNGMNRIGWPILGLLVPLFGIIITFLVAMFKDPPEA